MLEIDQSTLLLWAGRVGAAALALVVSWWLARISRHLLCKGLQRTALTPSLVNLSGRTIYVIVFTAGLLTALAILGVPVATLVTFSSTIVVVAGIALRESIANLVATISFLVFQPFKIGEWVELCGISGTVREILLFNTVLVAGDNRLVTLPNSKIQDSAIVNYSRASSLRVDLNIPLGYSDNLSSARITLSRLLENDPLVLSDPPPQVVVTELRATGLLLVVRAFVNVSDFWKEQNQLAESALQELAAIGITPTTSPLSVDLLPSQVIREDT
jgi:small conductance mechanosensitive channel